MLPTIVFMLALFFSIGLINQLVDCIINKKDTDKFYRTTMVLVIVLWSWLFYLLH